MVVSPVPLFSLNNGTTIPAVGVGCWMGRPGEGSHVVEMVKTALKLGYRHIDTAANYGDEVSVGQAIRESGVPREQIFVTTKLASEDHAEPLLALENSLRKLGLEFVDMYLMHWPMAIMTDGSALQPNESPTYIETWHFMEKLLQTGKTKAIGVSNLSQSLLSALLDHPRTTVIPAINQVEAHPCLPQHNLLKYCQRKGILLVAYSPVGKHKFADDEDILHTSKRLSITPAQVMLSWAVQRGTGVVPKSEKEHRLTENLKVVKLTMADMDTLDQLHLKQNMHRTVCGFHSSDLGGSCFGWTYEQLGWDFESGGVVRRSKYD